MESEQDLTLTPAQREIMDIIWQRKEATVSEFRQALGSHRELARNTVQTMLVRLEEKGWLQHREDGRSFLYSAKRPRRTSLGAKVAQIVDRWFDGAPDAMVTALIEYRGLSREEAERIRQMIEAVESKPKKRSKRE